MLRSYYFILVLIVYLGECWAGGIQYTSTEAKPHAQVVKDRRLSIDMDGDGNQDEFSLESTDGKSWRMMVKLANGNVIAGAFNEREYAVILGKADIAGDGRQQAVIRTGGMTLSSGVIVTLYNNRLFVFPDNSGTDYLDWNAHSLSCMGCTENVACLEADGKPSLVLVSSKLAARNTEPEKVIEDSIKLFDLPESELEHHWNRAIYRLTEDKFILYRKDSGVLPEAFTPPSDLPLDNSLKCGTAVD